jgi:hypothetical protein
LLGVIIGDVSGLDNVMLGFALFLGIGVFLFAMSWDFLRIRDGRPPLGRGLLASSLGGALDRAPCFRAARPYRRQCDDA